ncbi:MAG: hypothetical protein IVW55_16385 [Chloroflexi bacterium]|nr:hypothetical protein [Chloroflexota bacterium]
MKPRRNQLQIAMPLLTAVLLGVVVMTAGAIRSNNPVEQPSVQPGNSNVQPQTADPWPSFTMVFREEAYDWETGNVISSEVYQYAYTNRESWQLELLESSKDPRAVGSKTEYNNSTFTQAGVIDGHPLSVQVTKADKPYMATSWLVPVSIDRLSKNGGYQRAADRPDGRVELYKEEMLPCNSLTGIWQVRLCADGKQSYTQRTEKLMDPEQGIPLEITEKAGGKVTSSVKVTKLTYK